MSTPKPDDIWRMQAQFDVEGLVQALQAPEAATRKRAAAALRTIGATESVAILRTVVESENDVDTRLTMLSAIESLDNEAVEGTDAEPMPTQVDLLAEELASDDLPTAIAAVHKMAELGDKTAVVPLILTFNNLKTPIKLRLIVAEALLKLESAPVEVALLANLRHQDWEIRRNGAAILGQLKAEWAIEPLGKALGDPHPTVRKTALAALKYIGTPDARKVVARFATGLQRSNPPPPVSGQTGLLAAGRLLDKTAQDSSSEMLPKDIKIMRVSEKQKREPDRRQNERTTSILDASTVDDHERRKNGGDDSTE